jgi:hypothetical protein
MQELFALAYELYSLDELRMMLQSKMVAIPLSLLGQMVDALINRGYVVETVRGMLQLT